MMKVFLCALAWIASIAAPRAEDDVLLFTYFRDNGQHGVNLATSADGIHYTPLNGDQPVFIPPAWPGQNLTRDASVLYHDGVFHMVWTSGWTGRVFGYASSPDLKTWSEPRQIRPFLQELAEEDQPDNIWAPELHWDPAKRDFFILFASTTPCERKDADGSNNDGRPGSKYDNRMHITRTADFTTFTDARVYFDRDFASIDAVMRIDEASRRWVMVIKCSRDESLEWMPGRNLHLTWTAGMDTDHPEFGPLTGPIAGNHSPMFSDPAPRRSMAEGQTLLRYQGRWLLVWDEPAGAGFQLAESPDLKTWTYRRDARFPFAGKTFHGTLFTAPRSAVAWLK